MAFCCFYDPSPLCCCSFAEELVQLAAFLQSADSLLLPGQRPFAYIILPAISIFQILHRSCSELGGRFQCLISRCEFFPRSHRVFVGFRESQRRRSHQRQVGNGKQANRSIRVLAQLKGASTISHQRPLQKTPRYMNARHTADRHNAKHLYTTPAREYGTSLARSARRKVFGIQGIFFFFLSATCEGILQVRVTRHRREMPSRKHRYSSQPDTRRDSIRSVLVWTIHCSCLFD